MHGEGKAESRLMGLHRLTLEAFRERFGEDVLGVQLTPLAHECWVHVAVRSKTPELRAFAEQMERDFLEEGMHVSVFLRRPWREALRAMLGRRQAR